MLKSTCQQALRVIADTDKVLILIEQPGDPLSKRARQVLHSTRIKFEKLGYTLLSVVYSPELDGHVELSCARLPQLRIFKSKEMSYKYTGVPSDSDMATIFNEAM